ncbi:hypothetical protein NQ318_020948 [Aromia moschata]|uniref:Cytochrome c oxidase assembly factor 5 n=1 Tax=Aromia moschata TaxID=1265417 RepID=A0AAV8YNY5_9CUCU|nr:hypothetical protein NQ318_020948 [Aromia moschata]
MMRYEEENEKLADKSACAGVRADLKVCLLESDCCRVHKKTPKECLKANDGTVPTQCQVLRIHFLNASDLCWIQDRDFEGVKVTNKHFVTKAVVG